MSVKRLLLFGAFLVGVAALFVTLAFGWFKRQEQRQDRDTANLVLKVVADPSCPGTRSGIGARVTATNQSQRIVTGITYNVTVDRGRDPWPSGAWLSHPIAPNETWSECVDPSPGPRPGQKMTASVHMATFVEESVARSVMLTMDF